MPTYLNPKIIRLDSLELTRELTDDEIGVFRPADFCITNYGIIRDLTIRFVDLNVQEAAWHEIEDLSGNSGPDISGNFPAVESLKSSGMSYSCIYSTGIIDLSGNTDQSLFFISRSQDVSGAEMDLGVTLDKHDIAEFHNNFYNNDNSSQNLLKGALFNLVVRHLFDPTALQVTQYDNSGNLINTMDFTQDFNRSNRLFVHEDKTSTVPDDLYNKTLSQFNRF